MFVLAGVRVGQPHPHEKQANGQDMSLKLNLHVSLMFLLKYVGLLVA